MAQVRTFTDAGVKWILPFLVCKIPINSRGTTRSGSLKVLWAWISWPKATQDLSLISASPGKFSLTVVQSVAWVLTRLSVIVLFFREQEAAMRGTVFCSSLSVKLISSV